MEVERAWPSVERLGLHPGADPDRIRFTADLREVADAAWFVQESAPEDPELKRGVLAAIDRVADPDTILASSTSGIRPSVLQQGMIHAERIVVGHPFNPVYLLPLVEVVGGQETSEETLARVIEVYRDLDMYPLHVRNEIDGFLSDRLQEAMWREILHIVNDGIATTGELDDAITYGPGLRWAAMGTNLTFHLAGGDAGMRHMLAQFGPALEWPWTRLEAPELTEGLIDRMVEGTAEQAGGRSVEELVRTRDDALIATMEALADLDIGAGRIVRERLRRTGRTE